VTNTHVEGKFSRGVPVSEWVACPGKSLFKYPHWHQPAKPPRRSQKKPEDPVVSLELLKRALQEGTTNILLRKKELEAEQAQKFQRKGTTKTQRPGRPDDPGGWERLVVNEDDWHNDDGSPDSLSSLFSSPPPEPPPGQDNKEEGWQQVEKGKGKGKGKKSKSSSSQDTREPDCSGEGDESHSRDHLRGPRTQAKRTAAERTYLKKEDSGYDMADELMDRWVPNRTTKPPTKPDPEYLLEKEKPNHDGQRQIAAEKDIAPETITGFCKLFDVNERLIALPTASGWYPHREAKLKIASKHSSHAAVFYADPNFKVLKQCRQYAVLSNVDAAFNSRKTLGILRKSLVVILDWDDPIMKPVISSDMRNGLNSRCDYRTFNQFLIAQNIERTLTIQSSIEHWDKDIFTHTPPAPYLFPHLSPWFREIGWQWLLPFSGAVMPGPIIDVLELFGGLTRDKEKGEQPFTCPGLSQGCLWCCWKAEEFQAHYHVAHEHWQVKTVCPALRAATGKLCLWHCGF